MEDEEARLKKFQESDLLVYGNHIDISVSLEEINLRDDQIQALTYISGVIAKNHDGLGYTGNGNMLSKTNAPCLLNLPI